MLINDLQHAIKPTAQERALIDFIVKNPAFIETCTVRDLARESLTSPATVTRLCQKLGFSGFSDFRLRLVSEQRASRKNIYADLSHALVQKGSSVEEIRRTLPHFYNSIVYETNAHLSEERISQLKELIQSVRCLDLYATGMNYHAAARASFNFQAAGIMCNVFNEANVPLLERLTSNDGHLAMLLSHTGSNCKILEIGHILVRQGIPTVAITENAGTPLGELADVTIELFSAPLPSRLSMLSYSISLNYLFDLLYTCLLADTLTDIYQERAVNYYASLNQE